MPRYISAFNYLIAKVTNALASAFCSEGQTASALMSSNGWESNFKDYVHRQMNVPALRNISAAEKELFEHVGHNRGVLEKRAKEMSAKLDVYSG